MRSPPLGCTETVPAISGTTLTLDIEDWDSRNTIFFRFDVTEQISQGRCVVVIDQETIDEDIHTIEDAADAYPGVGPAKLVNEDRPTVPATPTPWLLWNEIGVGDMVLLPSGQVDDEGWFAMPENPVGKKGPFSLDDFVGGTIDEHWFDEVEDVMPLRNQDLASLVGRQCVAVVYDSEVNMNYNPIEGKLMGARLVCSPSPCWRWKCPEVWTSRDPRRAFSICGCRSTPVPKSPCLDLESTSTIMSPIRLRLPGPTTAAFSTA